MSDEENVPRSLPFFAASLAVLVAILGAIREWIPAPEWAAYPAVIWGFLTLFALTLLMVIIFLGLAVWGRKFRYIMNETEIAAYVAGLLSYYELDPNLTEAGRKTAALKDLRVLLTRQYGEAAMYNRALNFRRAGARATAFEALIFALFLAFMLIAITLPWHGRPGENTGDCNVRSIQSQDRGGAQDRGSAETGQLHGRAGPEMGQTDPTAAPDHQKGRVVLPASPPGTSDPGEEKVNGAAQPKSDAALPLEGETPQSPPKAR